MPTSAPPSFVPRPFIITIARTRRRRRQQGRRRKMSTTAARRKRAIAAATTMTTTTKTPPRGAPGAPSLPRPRNNDISAYPSRRKRPPRAEATAVCTRTRRTPSTTPTSSSGAARAAGEPDPERCPSLLPSCDKRETAPPAAAAAITPPPPTAPSWDVSSPRSSGRRKPVRRLRPASERRSTRRSRWAPTASRSTAVAGPLPTAAAISEPAEPPSALRKPSTGRTRSGDRRSTTVTIIIIIIIITAQPPHPPPSTRSTIGRDSAATAASVPPGTGPITSRSTSRRRGRGAE
mmetsp:Transcript_970/g.2787  ORF Transcript_970/g.2787 Transcript_970/m.2787 type:complete len:291 (-) Transcript_970:524-1396(-)